MPAPTSILLIRCPDRQGLVASVTEFLRRRKGNVVDLDEHVDAGAFFMRAEWEPAPPGEADAAFAADFQAEIAGPNGMRWSQHRSDDVPRMAVFVSRLSHCLYDILSRCDSGEWRVEIPLIVSNHPDLEAVARRFGKAFLHLPILPGRKAAQEARVQAALEAERIEFIVLARYMQTLSADFTARWPERIINIHHSFLPSFKGANPYKQAHERGVKLIGATAHYVTADLDEGPIIEQDLVRVTHAQSPEDYVSLGRDVEAQVLARAVHAHIHHRVFLNGNKTVVFPASPGSYASERMG
jgi:formyltetrahydrofolate deformylase